MDLFRLKLKYLSKTEQEFREVNKVIITEDAYTFLLENIERLAEENKGEDIFCGHTLSQVIKDIDADKDIIKV